MAKKIPRTDFSDKAKKARGISVSSFEQEYERYKANLDAAKKRVGALEEIIRLALLAFDENRRGDMVKILRRGVPSATAPSKPPTDGGSAA